MSCMISRRNFMRCVGISALAVASSSLLGGCNQFDAVYGKNDVVTWTDENNQSFTMEIVKAARVNQSSREDIIKKYQLKVDQGQEYVFVRFEVNNGTGSEVKLYEDRTGFFPFIKTEYTDEDIQEHFYEREKVEEGQEDEYDEWPNANNIVEAPSVIWAYENGNAMNRDNNVFGVICYQGTAGQPTIKTATHAKIPTGQSWIDGIGQITDNFKILRLVYRMMGKEVNFVIYPNDFE